MKIKISKSTKIFSTNLKDEEYPKFIGEIIQLFTTYNYCHCLMNYNSLPNNSTNKISDDNFLTFQ